MKEMINDILCPISFKTYITSIKEEKNISYLNKLSKDGLVSVRRAVVMNPNTSKEILEGMIKDTDERVLEGIIFHKNTDDKLIFKLLVEHRLNKRIIKLASKRDKHA